MKTFVSIKRKPFEKAVLRTNLTYKELAEKLEISMVYVSALKNEDYVEFRPSPKLRKRIMKVLNVKFDEIFEIQGDNGDQSNKAKKWKS